MFGKKQAVLAVLVAALGVAVYLNYYFSSQQPGVVDADTKVTDSTKNLGDAQYVGNSSTISPEEATGSSGEPSSGGESSGDYFAEARRNRENARAEALDILKDILNDIKGEDAAKKEALEKAAAIAAQVEQENSIESLVKAKGFADCVAYLSEGECNLVVKADELKPQEAVQITEIVTTQSKIVAQNIHIVAVK
ncbi:MAG: SpoIIIAH-like family protein [Clostridiales bacterium]|nr:SpoIIIAH-like family protein [Clostridiales bacterium]